MTFVPEQIVAVIAFVIVTVGKTEIATVCGVPKHEPVVEVGVTV